MTEPLHKRLERLRKDRKLTIKAVAAEIGVAYQTVFDWETGRQRPRHPRMLALAALYNLPLNYLLDDDRATPAIKPDGDETRVIGERLKYLRELCQLSVLEVARILGVTHTVIHRAESGEQLIRAWRLPALARLYKCSVDFILTGREQPHVAALHRAIRSGASQKILLAMLPNHD